MERRKFTDSFKKKVVREMLFSGTTAASISKKRKIQPSVLFMWRKKLRAEVSKDHQYSSVKMTIPRNPDIEIDDQRRTTMLKPLIVPYDVDAKTFVIINDGCVFLGRKVGKIVEG